MYINEIRKDISDTLKEIKELKLKKRLSPRLAEGYEKMIQERRDLLVIMRNKLKELNI